MHQVSEFLRELLVRVIRFVATNILDLIKMDGCDTLLHQLELKPRLKVWLTWVAPDWMTQLFQYLFEVRFFRCTAGDDCSENSMSIFPLSGCTDNVFEILGNFFDQTEFPGPEAPTMAAP
ncbi:hypothetical protein [Tateyamaria sp. ANG-S1]|uniref:hypothetical protein n=1 Tax=Tateyamaria sp. ANG-S1 TaxID=1577905 RepID=UPI00187CD8D4|nr:hypothetical protein [Tateyamaria sp. ANG-S1]